MPAACELFASRATAVIAPTKRLLVVYGGVSLGVLALFSLSYALTPLLDDRAALLLFLPAVLTTSIVAGLKPALFATALSLALGLSFLDLSLKRPEPHDFAQIALFLAIAGTIIGLSETLLRWQNRAQRYKRTAVANATHAAESGEVFRQLVAALTDHAVIMLDSDGKIVSWSKGALNITGWHTEEVIGKNFSILYPAESAASSHPAKQLAKVRTTGRFEEEALRLHKDGSTYAAHATITPLLTNTRPGYAMVLHDVTKRVQTEQMVRESAARLQSVLDASVDAVITLDEAGIVESANATTAELFGYSPQELIGHAFGKLLPESDRGDHADYLAAYRETGYAPLNLHNWDAQGLRKDGTAFPIELVIRAMQLGGRRRFTALVRDITDRKAAQREHRRNEHAELVMRELNHRIRNLFAVIQSIVSLTARFHTDVRGFQQALLERLRALVAAETFLSRPTGYEIAFRDLIRLALSPYEKQSHDVTIDGPALAINTALARTLSMVLHELTTNAVKHGSLSVPRGAVDVRWRLEAEHIVIEWSENGGPPCRAPQHKGFGSTVIDKSVRVLLGGDVNFDFTPEGLRCRLRIPRATIDQAVPEAA